MRHMPIFSCLPHHFFSLSTRMRLPIKRSALILSSALLTRIARCVFHTVMLAAQPA